MVDPDQPAVDEDFERRLSNLLDALRKLAPPELIAESNKLRLGVPPTDAEKLRITSNLVSAYSSYKLVYTLNAMGAANKERIALGQSLFRLCQSFRSIPDSEKEPKRDLILQITD